MIMLLNYNWLDLVQYFLLVCHLHIVSIMNQDSEDRWISLDD